LVSGQIAFGAAKGNLFPKIFADTNKHGAPRMAIMLSTLPQIPFLIFSRNESFLQKISQFVDFSCALFFIIYLISAFAFIKIFKKQYLLIGVLSVLFCLWIFMNISIYTFSYSMLIPLSGIFVYRRIFKVSRSE
jgi:amino acid transporter